MRIPKTRPSWIRGNFSVVVEGELVGYFRRFDSALIWRVHLARTTDAQSIYILKWGEILNIWRREVPV